MFSVTTFAENNIENLFSVLYAVDLYMISQLTTSDAPDLEKKNISSELLSVCLAFTSISKKFSVPQR